MKQILLILLDNASKFTHSGEVELGIRVLNCQAEAGSGTLRFSVKDTGIGIESQKVEKIMEAFSQAEAPSTKRYEGAGLGLAIARSLLKMMDSQLVIMSTPHTGSEFF